MIPIAGDFEYCPSLSYAHPLILTSHLKNNKRKTY